MWWLLPSVATMASIFWLRRCPVDHTPLGYGILADSLRKFACTCIVVVAWAVAIAAHNLTLPGM